MTTALLKNINNYIQLNEEDINLFNSFWTVKTLKKGELLIRNVPWPGLGYIDKINEEVYWTGYPYFNPLGISIK